MRVLVTGGTGFVGAHAVVALARASHDVRLLVRDRERIAPALGPLGVEPPDHVIGDVTDEASIARALDGCDAVLHAASSFSFDPRRRREFESVNLRGTEIVLRSALNRGLKPLVHVSSFAALLPASRRPLTPDAEPGIGGAPYSRSKAEQERMVRRLQQDGAPVIIVQPGAVFGPGDPHFGESDQLVHALLTGRMPIVPAGGVPIVDVRDLAGCLARALELSPAPRRFLVGGTFMSFRQLVALLAEVTGRPLSARSLPESIILPLASVAEGLARLTRTRPLVAREPPWITRQRATTDDSRAQHELGFGPRDIRETLADTVRSLLAAGRITREQAGTLGPCRP